MSNWIAPNSLIIGDVTLSKSVSVWWGANLNADNGSIIVGENSQVHDNAVINPSKKNTLVGTGVTIGCNSWIGNCIIKDGAYLGPNVTINNGCTLEEGAFIAAGSVVSADTTVPANEVWAGSPAEFLRPVRPDERESLLDQHQEYKDMADIYCEHTEMTYREWINYTHDSTRKDNMSIEDIVYYRLSELGMPTEEGDLDYYDVRHQHLKMYHEWRETGLNPWDQNPDSFEYENESFPEALKMYKKNYESYEDSKRYFEENPTEYPRFRTDKWETKKSEEPWNTKY